MQQGHLVSLSVFLYILSTITDGQANTLHMVKPSSDIPVNFSLPCPMNIKQQMVNGQANTLDTAKSSSPSLRISFRRVDSACVSLRYLYLPPFSRRIADRIAVGEINSKVI